MPPRTPSPAIKIAAIKQVPITTSDSSFANSKPAIHATIQHSVVRMSRRFSKGAADSAAPLCLFACNNYTPLSDDQPILVPANK